MVQGSILSYSVMRSMHGSRKPTIGAAPESGCGGWRVLFEYPCACGSRHGKQSSNVWAEGDHRESIVSVKCPTNGSALDVELVRP
jgi:hypothetical protein